MKKELPEGFSLEPEFKEESGVITLRIKGAGTERDTPGPRPEIYQDPQGRAEERRSEEGRLNSPALSTRPKELLRLCSFNSVPESPSAPGEPVPSVPCFGPRYGA